MADVLRGSARTTSRVRAELQASKETTGTLARRYGLIADRAYDANSLRRLLAEGGAKAVIPSTTSRKQPIPYDRIAYRRRNRIARMFSCLKDFRRVATL